MNTLHLFFVGLMAFVPNPNGSIDVLLVSAPDPECIGGQDQDCADGCWSPPHCAMLVVREEDVQGPCPKSYCPNIEPIDGFCVWPLNGIGFQIQGLAEQGLERRGGRGRNARTLGFTRDGLPEETGDSVDVSWLADMNAASDGGRIKPTVRLREDNSVLAQLTLSQGRLGVCNLVQYEGVPPRVPLFEFRPFNVGDERRSYRQALADEVGLNAPMESQFLYLYLTNADGVRSVVTLKAEGDHKAEVLILNVPSPHDDLSSECDNVGSDFARFFSWITPPVRADQRFLPHRTPEFRSGTRVQPTAGDGCEDEAVEEFLLGEDGYFFKVALAHCLSDPQASRKDCEDEVRDLLSVHTRPICPMATFER